MKVMQSVALLLLVMTLTACSTAQQTQGDATSEQGEQAEQGSEDEQVTIVYSRGKDDTKGTEKLVEAFEEKYPNIKVDVREMPTDTGKQHDAYVTAFNARSSEIDVLDIDVIWPAEFAQAGYTMELDRFIEQDGFDLAQYNEGALAAAQFNGKQWALPKFIDAGLLFYRKDVVSDDEVPTTWDELQQLAKEKQGENGTKFGYAFQGMQYEGLVCNAIEFVASYGGAIIDENGDVVVNSPETIKGLEKMVEIARSDIVPDNVTTFTEPETYTAFIEGQSVIIRNWPYVYALANDEDQSKIVGNVGVAPLPAGDKGSAAALGGWMTAINKNSEHPKEAWEFLKFAAGPEGQKINAIYGGRAPAIPALYEDEEVLEANPFYAEEGFVKALENAVPRPVAANYQEISEVMQIHISQAMTGQITVEEAVQRMEADIDEKLVQ